MSDDDEVHPVERDEAATVEAVADDEGRTAGAVAVEEAHRDDAGRGSTGSDDPDAWRLQAKIFGGIAVFMVVIATIYWFLSYEAAGTTFLVVAACMTGLPALYLGWPRGRGGAARPAPTRSRATTPTTGCGSPTPASGPSPSGRRWRWWATGSCWAAGCWPQPWSCWPGRSAG